MVVALLDATRVVVSLRATGILRGLGHNPIMTARPERVSVEVGEGDGGGRVSAVFRVDGIEPPGDLSVADRDGMLENMRGPDVLDAARFPTITFEGRYRGALEGGTLTGALVVRGASRPISMTVAVLGDGADLVASGEWEGKLTDLGVKPFRALMGALKLDDWIRLRLEARFAVR